MANDDEVLDTGLILQGNEVFAAYVEEHPDADPDKVMQMFFIDHPDILRDVVLPALRAKNKPNTAEPPPPLHAL